MFVDALNETYQRGWEDGARDARYRAASVLDRRAEDLYAEAGGKSGRAYEVKRLAAFTLKNLAREVRDEPDV